MSGWLNQLQSMLGQKTSGSGEQGLSKLLGPGALGGLAGLLVANKSSRKLLAKYGTGALLAGGGAIAGTVLWNKYKDRVRAAHRDDSPWRGRLGRDAGDDVCRSTVSGYQQPDVDPHA